MKLRLVALAATTLPALLSAAPAQACSLCACGDPVLAASDPAALGGTLRLQLDAEYVRARAGTEGTPASTDELTQWSYRLGVAYRPTDGLSFSATLPVVTKSMHTIAGGVDTPTSRLSGLGDVELTARQVAWRAASLGTGRVHELAATAGLSVPTGDAQARVDGVLVDPHGQVGSGAWGPFVGLGYLLEQGSWLGLAHASWRYRSVSRASDGSRYQFGAAWLWSVHAQYRPVRRVALDLGVDGRHAAGDRAWDPGAAGTRVENTGGTVLSVAPGAYLNAYRGAWLFVRAQLPFLERLRGEQDVLPTFTTGVQLQAL